MNSMDICHGPDEVENTPSTNEHADRVGSVRTSSCNHPITTPGSTACLTYGANGHPTSANALDGVQQHEDGAGGFV